MVTPVNTAAPVVATTDKPVTAPAATAPAKKAAPKPVKKAVKAAPEKAPAKAVKKATKKAPAAPKAAEKSTKKAPAPAEKKEEKKEPGGLRKPQIRILQALAKRDGLDRNEVAELAPCDVATLVEYLGSHDPARRAANDAKHFPSLLTLGLITAKKEDADGRDKIRYYLTAKGRTQAGK